MKFASLVDARYTFASIAGGVATYATGGRRAASGLETRCFSIFTKCFRTPVFKIVHKKTIYKTFTTIIKILITTNTKYIPFIIGIFTRCTMTFFTRNRKAQIRNRSRIIFPSFISVLSAFRAII